MCYVSKMTVCDGIIVEVHDNPEEALCDKEQAISIEKLEQICKKMKKIR